MPPSFSLSGSLSVLLSLSVSLFPKVCPFLSLCLDSLCVSNYDCPLTTVFLTLSQPLSLPLRLSQNCFFVPFSSFFFSHCLFRSFSYFPVSLYFCLSVRRSHTLSLCILSVSTSICLHLIRFLISSLSLFVRLLPSLFSQFLSMRVSLSSYIYVPLSVTVYVSFFLLRLALFLALFSVSSTCVWCL